MFITAVIPAHNEEASLPDTVESIRGQLQPVDRILVVSDNSTDGTVEVARALGVEVMETVGNTARKAGALNQALATLSRHGYVLAMDADTVLAPGFVSAAMARLLNPAVGGVGAVFRASSPSGLLETLQMMEWERYAEETDRTGKTFVMSGTAALIRWDALEAVRARFGRWYDESTITEDSRLSIDLKLVGYELRSPLECATETETMPTAVDLFRQRRRWYLGALQNVRDSGFNRVTWPYWRQQALLGVSVTLLWLYVTLTVLAALTGGLSLSWPWLAVGLIFVAERVLTVWALPVRYRVLAAAVLPELAYAMLLQSAYLAALWQFFTRQAGTWHHLNPKENPDVLA